MKRRIFLKSAAVACLIGIPYSLWRGVRYPRLSLETPPLPNTVKQKDTVLKLTDCFVSKSQIIYNQHANDSISIYLRAFAPEPIIEIKQTQIQQKILVNNISPDAVLNSSIKLNEEIHGINRIIDIPAISKPAPIQWSLPELAEYEFASIGDSGGSDELNWCIERAQQFNVKFFLHLGDFHYQASDYDSAMKLFFNAPMPCYVTIGNHDFHDNGLIVDKYLDDIGPLNHTFTLQNIRYVNIDTAASFLPVSGGKRAALMKALIADKHNYDDTVLFTHRPFYDPRPGEDHDFGNIFEKKWFVKGIKKAKINTLLAGHIHGFHDAISEDIRLLIAGQGLGHEDLIHQRQVAKLLIGKVTKGQPVDYRTEELAMPFDVHCHPHVSRWRKKNNTDFAKKINNLCEHIDKKN